jgi:hypothetical protein
VTTFKKEDTQTEARADYDAFMRLLSFLKKGEWAKKNKCYSFALPVV